MAYEPIAIVAMAGRFPGAPDVEAFWQNLCEARDTIRPFDAATLDPAVSAEDRADPAYVPARGEVDDVAMFAAVCFGLGPREEARSEARRVGQARVRPCRALWYGSH